MAVSESTVLAALRIAVLVALGWAAGGLLVHLLFARLKTARPLHAPPAGSPRRGILYAFGPALLPWAKESVRNHLPSYALGILLHLGVAAAALGLALSLLRTEPAPALRWGLGFPAAAGALASLGLFAKRIFHKPLHALSTADDYLSNALVTLFLGLGAGRALDPSYEPWFLGAAALMLFHLPVGKLRHCLFFFLSRAGFGAFFGRRGVFPPRKGDHA